MSKLNCPNCGAPISADNNKCPYCNTSYFDLSSIDINNDEPFYLKVRMGKMTLTQLVRVLPDMSINFESNSCSICNPSGKKLYEFTTSNSMFTNLNFEAIVDPYNEKRLCTITYEK
jgi:hypothetical protein